MKQLALQVAAERFDHAEYSRRTLILEVETRVRELGLWESDDDLPSRSTGEKSKGLALIDYAISDLEDDGLDHLGRDRGKLH